MAPGSIRLATLVFSLGLIVLTEISAWLVVQHFGMVPLYAIGLVRLIQICGILSGVVYLQNSLSAIGWSPSTWRKGIVWGALWSMAFGAVVAIAMGLLYLSGTNPLAIVHSPLPSQPVQRLLFFIIGGLVAPLAEEICFRGVLYNYFRRWGVVAALIASTLLFVILHSVHGFPLTQLVGGILFALSYEYSKNLMVPITIHATGNLAIFTLSLPWLSS
ncbi:MAG: type II CAAX endopeptidase family protein [Desulfobacteraceae bacterium]